jgi:hypothetical protein
MKQKINRGQLTGLYYIFWISFFSNFPNRISHIYNYVDGFGANGSGLVANYDTQTKTIDKDTDNFKYEAIYNLVNRLQLLCIPGLGKITLVMNKITGFTVKIQNVVRYINYNNEILTYC